MCSKVVYRGSLCGIFLDLSRTFGLGNIQLFIPRLILTVTQSKVDFLCIRVYMFYTRTGYHTWFVLYFSLFLWLHSQAHSLLYRQCSYHIVWCCFLVYVLHYTIPLIRLVLSPIWVLRIYRVCCSLL